MTFHKITSLFLASILLGSAVIGCASRSDDGSQSNGQTSTQSAVSIYPVEAKALEAPAYGEEDAAAKTAAGGANDFAFRLSSELLKSSESENFVCSPYSVWLPLAALLNATTEENKAALLDALGANGITEVDINRTASRMLYDLTKERNKQDSENSYNPLQIANAIFVDQDEVIKKEFAQAFADYFRGQAMNVNFKSDASTDAINQWASDHTEGLITDIVQEFDPNTVAAIANAIYFSDRWQWEFDEGKTVDDVFHAHGGDTTAKYMLRDSDGLTYYEDNQVQAMPLRFKTGGELYIILPKDGDATRLLSSMDAEYFQKIQQDSTSATGKLLLPRFKIESGLLPLKDSLIAIGIPLFDEQAAPLTGGLIERDVPVFLSDAVQKAVIEVNEKGTTAAAVTVMSADAASAILPTDPFVMKCDKPFVFILCDRTYDGGSQILFTGVVGNPGK